MRYVVRKCLSYYPSHRLTAKDLKSFAETQIEKRKTPPPPPPPPPNTGTTSGGQGGQIDPLIGSNGFGDGGDGGGYLYKPDRTWVMVAVASVVGIAMVVFFTIFLFNHSKGSGTVVAEQQKDTVELAPSVSPVPASEKRPSNKPAKSHTNSSKNSGGDVNAVPKNGNPDDVEPHTNPPYYDNTYRGDKDYERDYLLR